MKTFRVIKVIFLLVLLSFCPFSGSHAQTPTSPVHQDSIATLSPGWPRAAAQDVNTPENLIATYYATLSGTADATRDWNRFRSLFYPEAHFLNLKTFQKGGHILADNASVPQMIERMQPNLSKADSIEHIASIDLHAAGSWTIANVQTDLRIHGARFDTCAHRKATFALIHDVDRYWIAEILEDSTTDSGAISCSTVHP